MKIIFLFILTKLINSHYFVVSPQKDVNINPNNFSDIQTLFSSLNPFVEKVVFTDDITLEIFFNITTYWNIR